MAAEVDSASQKLLQEERELELQNERQQTGIIFRTEMLKLKQLKSFEILKSALTIFTSNTKFMLFMISSIIPLFIFMVFSEIKLQKAITEVPRRLIDSSSFHLFYHYAYNNPNYYDDESRKEREFLLHVVQLCLLYFVLYPVLEMFSMFITMKIAAKSHAKETETTFKEVLMNQNNSLKGVSVTFLCIHLLTTLILLGVFWIVADHHTLTGKYIPAWYSLFDRFCLDPIGFCLYFLSLALHSAFLIVLLYKYLKWSAFWNLSMVISILGEETGIWAFGMADYYGKHCKQTGFQLMVVFFAFGNVLRLPCLFAGLCDGSTFGGVLVAAIVVGLVCLGNLVKWVAFVLYFYDCKQQTLEKKNDKEIGKTKNVDNV